MNDFKSEWNERLGKRPFKQSQFSEALRGKVEDTIKQRGGKNARQKRLKLVWGAAIFAAAAVVVILFSSGIIPLDGNHRVIPPPAGPNVEKERSAYDPAKIKIGDKVGVMTARRVETRDLGAGQLFVDIEFDSDTIELTGSYRRASMTSDGAEGPEGIEFVPDEKSSRLLPYHNLFKHAIVLRFLDSADLERFGSGQSGQATVQVRGYREIVSYKDEIMQNSTLVNVVSKTISAEESDPPTNIADASYDDFVIPSGMMTVVRQLDDEQTNPDAIYRLHEYKVADSLDSVDAWLRGEAQRLKGTVKARYSYDASGRIDLILQLPAASGTRVVSTYSPKYGNEQHLIVIESTFSKPTEFTTDTEDHALVVVTPQKDGNTKETFKANYDHQHTDIFSLYFYSAAFFKQLEAEGYGLDIQFGPSAFTPDYKIGYFDADGKEVNYEDVSDAERAKLIFGVQLETDFLPKDGLHKKQLLLTWARTALLGDKTHSGEHEGTKSLNFLRNGKVFATYKLSDLLANGGA